jgi:hypothetical protein
MLPAVQQLLLAGCGGSSDAAQEPESTQPKPSASSVPPSTIEATTALPTPTPAARTDPNVGDRALRIGETRQGSDFRTRLVKYRYPYPPVQYREASAHKQYFGLFIRECLRPQSKPTDDSYSTYNGEWYIVSPTGAQVTSSSSYDDWPQPKFPENVTMAPGDCLIGWLTVEVPIGMKVAKIVYRPGGETVAEWLP